MPRKIADCREFPSEMNCTLAISGEEDEVVRAAAQHAVSVHGHQDSQELRDQIRRSLKDDVSESDKEPIFRYTG
jgi:predicted small metal-binding protein